MSPKRSDVRIPFYSSQISCVIIGFGGGNDSSERSPPAPSGPGPQEGGKPTIIPIEYEYDVQPGVDSSPFIPIDDTIVVPQPAEPILIPVSPRPAQPPPAFPPPSPLVLSPSPSPDIGNPIPSPLPTNDIVEPVEDASPPANTIFVPDVGDIQGSLENSAEGNGTSRTTTIIIAVSCSIGGIIVLSSLIIFCWYCRSRRRGVADSGGDVEAGGRGGMRVRSRTDIVQRSSAQSDTKVTEFKLNGHRNSSHSEKTRATLEAPGTEGVLSTLDILKHGALWKAGCPSNGSDLHNELSGHAMGPMATAASLGPMAMSAAEEVSKTKQNRNVANPGLVSTSKSTSCRMVERGSLLEDSSSRKESTLADYNIDFSSIEICECVGQGAFGKVYRSVWNETPVAVKFLMPWKSDTSTVALESHFEKRNNEAIMSMLETEADILSSLRHPNIVQFMGICAEPPCIVSEFCEKGSLLTLLKSAAKEDKFLPTWEMCLKMVIDAATGILYLHSRSKPIVHCDLKSSNILVDADYRVKICDFNLSSLLEGSTGSSLGSAHNPRWLAPETLGGEGYSKESDVYAFGIVMWEMLTRSIPWSDLKHWDIVTLVRDGARPPVPNFWEVHDSTGKDCTYFDEYVTLMTTCWSQNPYDRPTFAEIVRELKEMSVFLGSGPNDCSVHMPQALAKDQDKGPDASSISISSTKVYTSC